MRVLVTGAGGFVGAHLAARLVRDGHEVWGTVRSPTATERLRRLGVVDDVRLLSVDLAERGDVETALAPVRPDVVFMLAAARSKGTVTARASTAAVNATSAQWIVDTVAGTCATVVRLGSSTEYGESEVPMAETTPLQPRGFFGATKAAGSLLTAAAAAERGMRAAILRAFQVYGPMDHPNRLVPTALRAARTGEILKLTERGRCRDWVWVDDVVEACVLAAHESNLPAGQVLNIGTGIQTANEELVDILSQVSGRPITVDIGAHEGRHWDAASWVSDPTLARTMLGWTPKVTLDDGLRRCWEWEEA